MRKGQVPSQTICWSIRAYLALHKGARHLLASVHPSVYRLNLIDWSIKISILSISDRLNGGVVGNNVTWRAGILRFAYILGHYVTLSRCACVYLAGSGPGCPDLDAADVPPTSPLSAVDVVYYYDSASGRQLRANASCRHRNFVFAQPQRSPSAQHRILATDSSLPHWSAFLCPLKWPLMNRRSDSSLNSGHIIDINGQVTRHLFPPIPTVCPLCPCLSGNSSASIQIGLDRCPQSPVFHSGVPASHLQLSVSVVSL